MNDVETLYRPERVTLTYERGCTSEGSPHESPKIVKIKMPLSCGHPAVSATMESNGYFYYAAGGNWIPKITKGKVKYGRWYI